MSRSLVIALFTRIHSDIPKDYEDSLYRYRFVIQEAGRRHLFSFTIDDATTPDHLIIASIRHDVWG